MYKTGNGSKELGINTRAYGGVSQRDDNKNSGCTRQQVRQKEAQARKMKRRDAKRPQRKREQWTTSISKEAERVTRQSTL